MPLFSEVHHTTWISLAFKQLDWQPFPYFDLGENVCTLQTNVGSRWRWMRRMPKEWALWAQPHEVCEALCTAAALYGAPTGRGEIIAVISVEKRDVGWLLEVDVEAEKSPLVPWLIAEQSSEESPTLQNGWDLPFEAYPTYYVQFLPSFSLHCCSYSISDTCRALYHPTDSRLVATLLMCFWVQNSSIITTYPNDLSNLIYQDEAPLWISKHPQLSCMLCRKSILGGDKVSPGSWWALLWHVAFAEMALLLCINMYIFFHPLYIHT